MSALALALLVLAPGAAFTAAFGRPRPWPSALWRAALAGLFLASWAALALAQLSIFSPAALALAIGAGSAAVLAVRRRRASAFWSGCRALPRGKAEPLAAAALAALLAAAAFVPGPPGEHFAGGWDPGAYLAAGGSVAERGGLIFRDELLASLDGAERDLLYPEAGRRGILYPGFYVLDAGDGKVVPQFQPLYHALLATALAFAGERAMLAVNPALALVSLLLLFRLGAVFRGRGWGLVAAALFGLNVIQLWNSRFPTSELVSQAFLLGGFSFLHDLFEEGEGAAGFAAALGFGLAPMATVTTLMVLPFPVAAVLVGGGRTAPRWEAAAFLAPLAALGAHFLLWSGIAAPSYLRSVVRFFPELHGRQGVVLAGAAVLAAAAAAVLLRRARRLQETGADAFFARFAAAVLVIAGLVWFWMLRPRLGASAAALSALRLDWFVGPALVPLLAAGAALAMPRPVRRAEAALVLGGLAMLFFFLHDPRMYPTYPFTLRRFTPLAVPAAALLAATLPATLLGGRRRLGRIAGAALLALAVGLPLHRNRLLVRHADYRGLTAFIGEVDRALPGGALVLCEGRVLAYALDHVKGREVYIVDRQQPPQAGATLALAQRRLSAGGRVVYLAVSERPWAAGLAFEPLFTRRLATSRLEQDRLRYPDRVKAVDLEVTAYDVVPIDRARPDGFPARVELGDNGLGLGAGFSVPAAAGPAGGKARWTSAAASLAIPWPAGGGAVLALRMAAGQGRSVPAEASLLLDGRPVVERLAVGPAMAERSFAVPGDAGPAPRRRALEIRSTTWNPSDAGLDGYPPALGVLVDWVEVRPAPGRGAEP